MGSIWSALLTLEIAWYVSLKLQLLHPTYSAFTNLISPAYPGSGSYRVPWLIDDDDKSPQGSTAVLRKFTQLKCRLMPYLYSEAVEAIKQGLPVSVRAMALEFPEDRTAWLCDQQFMLGSKILVAPVFNESGDVEFYLPAGRWTSFWDGKLVVQGPKWVKEKHDFGTLPLYVREGAILVLGKEGEMRTDYDWSKPENHEMQLYEPAEKATCRLYDAAGKLVATLRAVETHGSWKVGKSDIRAG